MTRRRPGYHGVAPRPSSVSPNKSQALRLGTAGNASTMLPPLRRGTNLHKVACMLFAVMVSTAEGQMDPVEMQRQIQQQMGGGGGGGGATPNRIGKYLHRQRR